MPKPAPLHNWATYSIGKVPTSGCLTSAVTYARRTAVAGASGPAAFPRPIRTQRTLLDYRIEANLLAPMNTSGATLVSALISVFIFMPTRALHLESLAYGPDKMVAATAVARMAAAANCWARQLHPAANHLIPLHGLVP